MGDVITSLPRPILPAVPGEPDYHTLHAICKMQQANARPIDTYRGVGAFGHLGVIISDIAYDGISLLEAWVNPTFPGRTPEEIAGGRTSA
jgi:hypothetical protein